MDDVLHRLRAMRLTGGIFLDAEFTAPWCVTAQVTPEDCAPFTTVPRQIIAYHYVTVGELLLKLDAQPPLLVRQGEIVVFPRNDAHVIGSSLNAARPRSADSLIQVAPDGGLARIRHGGGGARTQILCGFFGHDMPHNPTLDMLPAVLRLNVADGDGGSWIESSFRFAVQEMATGAAGSPAIPAKLAELLFLDAVRRFLACLPSGTTAWRAGAQDPVVGRALGLLHSQMTRRWSTDEIAREVGLSRSAFAERFNRAVGDPPMRYLARQRLARAAVTLRESSDPVARVAYAAGYESEASFNRSFKREFGAPPAEWRRREAAEKAGKAPTT